MAGLPKGWCDSISRSLRSSLIRPAWRRNFACACRSRFRAAAVGSVFVDEVSKGRQGASFLVHGTCCILRSSSRLPENAVY